MEVGGEGVPISCGAEVGHLLPSKFGPGGKFIPKKLITSN
jgi:hypothetical protein